MRYRYTKFFVFVVISSQRCASEFSGVELHVFVMNYVDAEALQTCDLHKHVIYESHTSHNSTIIILSPNLDSVFCQPVRITSFITFRNLPYFLVVRRFRKVSCHFPHFCSNGFETTLCFKLVVNNRKCSRRKHSNDGNGKHNRIIRK